ncbi:MAG: metallophosphoesterase, partial [Nitrososphaerales archaeon]
MVSDLHLSDKADDEYRWQIFEFLHGYYAMTEDKNLIILGDLTDEKDHHSAKLVNAIADEILTLRDKGMEIFILKGNHDYIDPACPFFDFLDSYEYVNYITWPKTWLIQGERCLFLPHTRNPIEEWEDDDQVFRNRKK